MAFVYDADDDDNTAVSQIACLSASLPSEPFFYFFF